MEPESSEETISRLTRELENVSSQCRTSHRMAVYWQHQATKTEKLRARMERSLETWKRKLREQPKGQQPTDAELSLWAAEAETTDTDTSDLKVW